MNFPKPEVLEVIRSDPRRVRIGDCATVRLAPGLLDFLMTSPNGSAAARGRGTHPMSGIPLGIALEAAIEACGGQETGIDVLRACECTYDSPVRRDEPLIGRARVGEIGPRHITLEATAESEADGRILIRARLVLVRVGEDGRAERLA
ncbi:MAG: hypothetical protein N2111_13645 [Candidatus Sumerlaeaceae bacterium]|nr:hypothetical protein [Candidatus Sumerlaeaceae bacterium]